MVKSNLLITFLVIFSCHLYTITLVASPKKAYDFSLNSPEGELSLSDLRGQVVLIFFGFTACPDICPISLSTISRVFQKLEKDELEKSKALFITLDPKRDKVELMKEYTSFFHENIIGLTDQHSKILEVAKLYDVNFKKKIIEGSALGYVINHTADIYLIDSFGMLIEQYPHDVDAEVLFQKIRSLLSYQS